MHYSTNLTEVLLRSLKSTPRHIPSGAAEGQKADDVLDLETEQLFWRSAVKLVITLQYLFHALNHVESDTAYLSHTAF